MIVKNAVVSRLCFVFGFQLTLTRLSSGGNLDGGGDCLMERVATGLGGAEDEGDGVELRNALGR